MSVPMTPSAAMSDLATLRYHLLTAAALLAHTYVIVHTDLYLWGGGKGAD
jgi:hypothetical protein